MKTLTKAGFVLLTGWALVALTLVPFIAAAFLLFYFAADLGLHVSSQTTAAVLTATGLGAVAVGDFIALRTGLRVVRWASPYEQQARGLILIGGLGIVLSVTVSILRSLGL